MLKIREPIKTVVNPGFLSSQEAFTERIAGNYMQIGEYISDTDLLHLVTQPPEIFLMDGGMTTFANATNVENTQIQKVSIINNLLNRIMVSADASLSYQDTVYITNILHKLGIKDEKKFMKEVRRLTQETKNQNDTINLYWDNLYEIREMIENYSTEERNERRTEEEVLNQNILHLHEEINRRWNTAAVYRILQNFYESNEGARNITNEEYRVSEQGRLSREILLNKLRETVRGEVQPLIFRHDNIYEGDEEDITNVTVQDIQERVTSAVLLSLVDNIYADTYNRLEKNVKNWIVTDAAYYGAAENTLYRIEQNTEYLQYLYEHTDRSVNITEEDRSEERIIKNLLDMRRSEDIRIQQSLGGNIYENQNIISREGDTNVEINVSEYPEADITYLTNEENVEETTVEGEHRDEFTEKVYQTYQQNIARNEKYMRSLQSILDREAEPGSTESPMERTIRESKEALIHPKEFAENMRANEERAAQRIETIRTETEKLLLPQQQRIHELIREYIREPERFYHTNIIGADNLGLLMQDIEQAGREERGENITLIHREGDTVIEENTVENRLPTIYPPSSDTTVPGSVPGETGRIPESVTEKYRDFVTETIFPVNTVNMVHRRDSEIIENITDRVVERWHERQIEPLIPEYRDENNAVAIVHRSTETTVDEETIESLRNEIRNRDTTNRTVETTVENREEQNRIIVNTLRQEVMEQNEEEIQRVVNRTVRGQMNAITDKVYGKIERQLKSEQRRRGL
ncbi:MAG: hypothetical protein K6A69_04845 [Lachnospiraceae bacterium]|nr:hypothetical protein [Lachnospiraceae bacterium]